MMEEEVEEEVRNAEVLGSGWPGRRAVRRLAVYQSRV